MAYSELIKDFEHIRNYMREFYVYGFKTRADYDAKSARSYDNEKRRLESWLGDYMQFRQESNGKRVFISVDSRAIDRNPLYKAFKTKSFTDNDIIFHFFVLDLLYDGKEMTSSEIMHAVERQYLSDVPNFRILDESTIRKKLKEYVGSGILLSKKQGNKTLYYRHDTEINRKSWEDSIAFFTESNPLGVIGSFRNAASDSCFRFKHNYILSALDSEVLYSLAVAVRDKKRAEIEVWSRNNRQNLKHDICPARFYLSVQNGRQYVLVSQSDSTRPLFYRLDLIRQVTVKNTEPAFDELRSRCDQYATHVWGVSKRGSDELEHFEMQLRIGRDEQYIVNKLKREKRSGTVTQIDEANWLFSVDVYDARELLPWIREFTGRIVRMNCSNEEVAEAYHKDLRQMLQMYGGGTDAVQ